MGIKEVSLAETKHELSGLIYSSKVFNSMVLELNLKRQEIKGTNRDPGVRLDLRSVRVAADRSIPRRWKRTSEQPRATVGAGKTAGRLDPPEQEARCHVCLPKRGRESSQLRGCVGSLAYLSPPLSMQQQQIC